MKVPHRPARQRRKDELLWHPNEARHAPGTAPGTLIATPDAKPTTVSMIAWTDDSVVIEQPDATIEMLQAARDDHDLMWVNVEGLADLDELRAIGVLFNIHPLALEDVSSSHSRAKVERYDDRLFIVSRMAAVHDERLRTEQVCVFFGEGFVITFQEGLEGDCFEPVRKRARSSGDYLRTVGADFLAYTLLDAVVDGYFPVLEYFGERLEALEEELLMDPTPRSMAKIHHVKRDLLALRRAIWPQRETLSSLVREEMTLMRTDTRTYVLDAYDHCVQIIDLLETYRELASGLVDLYLSSVSNRMNEVMRVLTVIATIFIPLTFITSLYGMNFDTRSPWNMPELELRYGYLYVMGGMVVILIAMLMYFRRKGWLGGSGGAQS